MPRWLPAILCLAVSAISYSQDTLETMPRYDRYTRLSKEIGGSVVSGGVSVTWSEDSSSFTYQFKGDTYKYDIAARTASKTDGIPTGGTGNPNSRRRGGVGQPARGRQFSVAISPDGKLRAESVDRNVYIQPAGASATTETSSKIALTTEGSVTARIKYGTASWVYGEELGVREAMWWSPDSAKLAYYRFDEGLTKDYYVTLDEGKVQNRLDTEAYPKAGAPNPKVELYVYDLATKQTTKVRTDFSDATLGEYIYDVRWSADGKYLFFNRTNRHQNIMEFCLADPATGEGRAIVREEQPQSWAENHPQVLFLKDNHRFIWASERGGYKNYYLYDLEGKLLKTLTKNKLDAISVLRVDEDANEFFYTAYGPDNPYFRQLHRASLDGTADHLLTNPSLDHEVTLAPNGKFFSDIAQSPDTPPVTRLVDGEGKVLDTFAKSETTKFEALGLRKTEVFTYTAADDKTKLYGLMYFPSDFDPKKKYPVLLTVYGGPESGGISPRFGTPNPITEFGFIVVNLAGRGTTGRGKAFRDAVYKKLGFVEIDDQAAGIKSLASRPYVDLARVGVFGTSYGGYSTVMCMLRHPETFAVGCASSSVTDWHNYDSIYTERYMGLPDPGDNESGYNASAAVEFANKLQGYLMLYFGSADNNVHPSNTYQLVQALERAGKRYDMQVGTDREHTQMNTTRMWEYFITHLIVHPRSDPLKVAWNSRRYRKARMRAANRNAPIQS